MVCNVSGYCTIRGLTRREWTSPPAGAESGPRLRRAQQAAPLQWGGLFPCAGREADSQRENLGARLAVLDGQKGDGAGRLAAAIRRAAGIEQEQSTGVFHVWNVRMAENDHAGAGKCAAGVAGI